MKALELTVFEKHPGTDGAAGPVYRVGGSFTPYPIVAREKRFTEAELAAAHWKARAYGWPVLQADTLYRFAALPHYDEAHK